jgi:signal transduction histidine kinase
VYRVVQEALTNCARHSKARTIALGLTANDQVLTMAVQDDGIGFDPRAHRDGLGLRGIDERVKELGGHSRIRTSSDGTVLAMTLPVPASIPEARLARVAG